MKKDKKIYFLFSILLTILCVCIVDRELQNDTYSAIKIGNYILNNGIDFIEHFNIDPTLTYHNARWLFNVIIASVYNSFSFVGVYGFTVIISSLLGLTMFNVLLKYNKNLFISFVITAIIMFLFHPYLTARAQLVSYLLLFLEIVFIEKLIKEKKWYYIIVLTILSILIANIHTTIWPMTLVVFLPYFMEYFLPKIFKKMKRLYSETDCFKILLIAFIIVLITGLCTPLGSTPYTYMFKTMNGFSTKFISELQKPNILFASYTIIPLIIYIYLFVYLKGKIKISDIFMLGGLFFMGALASRNVAFFLVVSPICMSRAVMNNLVGYEKQFNRIEEKILKDRIVLFIISIVIIVASASSFVNRFYYKNYVNESMYPVGASDYILENIDIDNMRLFNGFGNGAYLEFREMKVFLDSRSEVYCEEFNDTTILKDWYNAANLRKYYKTIFDKYNFNYVLLSKKEPLYNYVKHDKDYKKIYSDEYFVLYEKVE